LLLIESSLTKVVHHILANSLSIYRINTPVVDGLCETFVKRNNVTIYKYDSISTERGYYTIALDIDSHYFLRASIRTQEDELKYTVSPKFKERFNSLIVKCGLGTMIEGLTRIDYGRGY